KPEIRRQRKEIDKRSALRFQDESISEPIRRRIDSPRGQRSDYSSSQSDHCGFKKEDQFDFAILCADRLHDSNLARALEDRHDHRIGYAEARYQQRYSPEQSQHRINNQKDSSNLIELIDDREAAES